MFSKTFARVKKMTNIRYEPDHKYSSFWRLALCHRLMIIFLSMSKIFNALSFRPLYYRSLELTYTRKVIWYNQAWNLSIDTFLWIMYHIPTQFFLIIKWETTKQVSNKPFCSVSGRRIYKLNFVMCNIFASKSFELVCGCVSHNITLSFCGKHLQD